MQTWLSVLLMLAALCLITCDATDAEADSWSSKSQRLAQATPLPGTAGPPSNANGPPGFYWWRGDCYYRNPNNSWQRVQPSYCDATLTCIHPVFTEERRLLHTLDGRQNRTQEVIQAIMYLRKKYCVFVQGQLTQDQEIPLEDNCKQYSGILRGERVYWGDCNTSGPLGPPTSAPSISANPPPRTKTDLSQYSRHPGCYKYKSAQECEQMRAVMRNAIARGTHTAQDYAGATYCGCGP
jgi:hypothetical protein